jgi:hypothetical protein
MIDTHAALCQDFFQITVGNALPDVEEQCMQNHMLPKLRAFERHYWTNLIDKSRDLINHLAEICERTGLPALRSAMLAGPRDPATGLSTGLQLT